MNRQTRMAVLTFGLFAAVAARAQVTGTVITTEGRPMPGQIRWKPREKAYAITANNIEVELPLANVRELQIPRPRELDAAIASLAQGNPSAAIPILEKIATDYLMLQWDGLATRLLAEAFVKAGEPEKAIRVCERVIASNPQAAYLGEMAPAYWQALLKTDRLARLEDLLAQAIKSGDREASAFALIMRGDLILAQGNTPETARRALRDGYLRVITLYKGVKDAQAEALYKAAKAFERIGQTQRADEMRTRLKGEFGASEWARQP